MEKIRITIPNIGDEDISFDVISKWNVDIESDFGERLFCRDVNSGFLFSISNDDYRRVFDKDDSRHIIKINKEFFDNFLYDCKDGETDDIVEFKIGYIPHSIQRISDGEILYLNKDNKTYSFKELKNNSSYSWARLFLDPRAKGEFKPIGWVNIKNLDLTHKILNK